MFSSGVDCYDERQPLGVVAGITPFNFPVMVPLWMMPMALACGNAFILKPSERDPSASNLLHGLWREAGLRRLACSAWCMAARARWTPFWITPVSRRSASSAPPRSRTMSTTRGSASGKRVQALGGAKNHLVVMPDADLDQAADALMGAGYGSAGERCMAVSVAVPVGEKTADALVAKLKPRVQALKVGPSTDASAEMGPLVTGAHRDKVSSYIDAGAAAGAELVVDGRGLKLQGYENGFWLGGTLLDRVTPQMSVYKDEIFGPVLSVVRAGDYEDAVGLINANPFANGTALFTRDGDAARDFADRIQVGMVGINVPIPVPVGTHSFGGGLEVLHLRRTWHLWPRKHTLLYAPEDGDIALACRHPVRRPVPFHRALSNATVGEQGRFDSMRLRLAFVLLLASAPAMAQPTPVCGFGQSCPPNVQRVPFSRGQPRPGIEQHPHLFLAAASSRRLHRRPGTRRPSPRRHLSCRPTCGNRRCACAPRDDGFVRAKPCSSVRRQAAPSKARRATKNTSRTGDAHQTFDAFHHGCWRGACRFAPARPDTLCGIRRPAA